MFVYQLNRRSTDPEYHKQLALAGLKKRPLPKNRLLYNAQNENTKLDRYLTRWYRLTTSKFYVFPRPPPRAKSFVDKGILVTEELSERKKFTKIHFVRLPSPSMEIEQTKSYTVEIQTPIAWAFHPPANLLVAAYPVNQRFVSLKVSITARLS